MVFGIIPAPGQQAVPYLKKALWCSYCRRCEFCYLKLQRRKRFYLHLYLPYTYIHTYIVHLPYTVSQVYYTPDLSAAKEQRKKISTCPLPASTPLLLLNWCRDVILFSLAVSRDRGHPVLFSEEPCSAH